jgi:hypothetical protein
VGLGEVWDAQVLLDDADQLARAAFKVNSRGRSCPLFQEVHRSGRQQQLEGLEILLATNSGVNLRAVRVGMRILVEDAFLLESSFVRAAEALLRIMKDTDNDDNYDEEETFFSKRTIECARNDLRTMIKSCKNESLDIGKNTVFVFEICPLEWNKSGTCSTLLDGLNNLCLELYDNCFSPDDQIGLVSNNVNDARSVEIGSKEDNEGRQRTFLDVVTSICSAPPSSSDDVSLTNSTSTSETYLPIDLQMSIDSSVSLQNDSYIVWITDGYIRYESNAMISLRNQIERLNEERCYQIHVLIIGV